MSSAAKTVTFGSPRVSGLWQTPSRPQACFVMAHGAGAGMTHALLETVAAGLVADGIACLRYQFPYMERARSALICRRCATRRFGTPWPKPHD